LVRGIARSSIELSIVRSTHEALALRGAIALDATGMTFTIMVTTALKKDEPSLRRLNRSNAKSYINATG
jgi:hypothetical protein